MQSSISLILIFACFFPNSEAEETPAMLDLFEELANGSPASLTDKKFAEFVGKVFKSPTASSNVNKWYKSLPQKGTRQEMIDFCSVYGNLVKDTYFTIPPAAAKIHDGFIEALYSNCPRSMGGGLTLEGLKKFVSFAFTGVTLETIDTWNKLVNAVYKFDLGVIKTLCKNNADRLNGNYFYP